MDNLRSIRIKADDGVYTSVRVTDADGRVLDSVTRVEWSVNVGELTHATVHFACVPSDIAVEYPRYILEMPDTNGVPLPEGLTVAQAEAIRAAFGGLAEEYRQALEERAHEAGTR